MLFRKGSNEPYHTHPIKVANILSRYGYNDEITQCIALLHDTVEDTNLITGEIKERFGYEISNGVFVLSKNTITEKTYEILSTIGLPFDIRQASSSQLYKLRLSLARKKVKRVKIADMIHNTQDLCSLTKEGSIERKLQDSEFFIQIGREIAPIMTQELEQNISNYNQSISK